MNRVGVSKPAVIGWKTPYPAEGIATGKGTDACYPRHRSDEFLRFLKQVGKAYPAGEAARVGDTG